MESLRLKVQHTVKRYNLLQTGDTVVIGVSGGADSICLLHILLSLSDELSLSAVRAVHVHHGLRGVNADRDEMFVREICTKWNVPLTVHHIDVAKEAALHGESLEEAGRRCRYTAFEQEIKPFVQVKIATAHNMTDCAETVLLNQARGCGMAGLGGIPIKRGHIVRPLLHCSSEAIRDYCREHALAYVVDETNDDTVFSRNRIRLEVMPALCKINSSAVKHIADAALIARNEHEFVTELAQRAWDDAQNADGSFRIDALVSMNSVLFTNGLQGAVAQAGGTVEQTHMQTIVSSLGEPFAVSVPGDLIVRSDGESLAIVAHRRYPVETPSAMLVKPPCELNFCGIGYRVRVFSAKDIDKYAKIHKNLFNFCVSYDMISDSNVLILRTRKEGDTLRPRNRRCTKSLKKWCNETGIPSEQRDRLPLLCDKDGILAILGHTVDERAVVTDKTERVVLFEVLY